MSSRGWNGAGYSHPDVAQINDGPSLRVGLRRLGPAVHPVGLSLKALLKGRGLAPTGCCPKTVGFSDRIRARGSRMGTK